MYSDDQFLESLRAEILANQERRFAYVKLKLGFIFAVLGISGVASIQFESVRVAALLAPVIALVFDLYIISEDYSVKRIGVFFARMVTSSNLANLWETLLPKHRDPFTQFAAPISTSLAVLPGIFVLGFPDERTFYFYTYVVFASIAIASTVAYEYIKLYKVRKFEADLPDNGMMEERDSEDA